MFTLTTDGKKQTFFETRKLEAFIRSLPPTTSIIVETESKRFAGTAKVALRTSRKNRSTINLWAVLANVKESTNDNQVQSC